MYDVGMYDGSDTAEYLAQGYRVVAIEANPELVATARQRFGREVADGRLIILNVAVSDRSDTDTLWISDEHLAWSSLEPDELRRRGVQPRAITVQCRPFASILAEYGTPYFVKVDVERSDLNVLRDLDPDRLPCYCSVELGYDRDGLRDIELFVAAVEKGFSAFKIIAQEDFSALDFEPYAFGPAVRRKIPIGWKPLNLLEYRRHELVHRLNKALTAPHEHPSTLGAVSAGMARRIVRSFQGEPRARMHPSESSGPFGEHTPGRWMTAEAALFTWLAFRLRYTRAPHGTYPWHDLHCRQ